MTQRRPVPEEVRVKQYLDLMRHVWEHGVPKRDRTGTGTPSIFGYQMFPTGSTGSLSLRCGPPDTWQIHSRHRPEARDKP